MNKTLIILNPHAAGGRARELWTKLEPLLWDKLGELVVAVTQHPEEVAENLDKAVASGLTRVIAIGGDGTNNTLVNAITTFRAQHPDSPPIVFGTLPVGTGRDWARSTGIPLDYAQAADWIANAQAKPTDLGLLSYEHAGKRAERHFLNIASTGLSGDVDRRVNNAHQRRPWTFLAATIAAILNYKPLKVQVTIDGQPWYEGKTLVTVVANGTTFGHGMKIAPNAVHDDGLFDVVVVESTSKLETLATLRHVYDGSHLNHPAVHHCRARQVRIDSVPLDIDIDGEYLCGQSLDFSVLPGGLQLLRA